MQTSPYNLPCVSPSKRWRIYQLYAWGIPLVMTTMIIISDLMPMPSTLDPQLKVGCWVYNPVLLIVYVYGPAGLSLLTTFIFFGLTVHIIKYASIGTVDVLRNNMLNVSVKLLIVTGMFWTIIFICSLIGFNTLMCDSVYYRFGFLIYFVLYGEGIAISLVHIDLLQLCKKCRRSNNPDSSPQPAPIAL
ncbi:hypothetical protein CHUAL_012098 [Chamberlinius hualienensis]